MPRRKKNGQSPARVPVRPSDGENPGYLLPPGHHDAMENNKDTIVKSMQEMFLHLDPEVIHIVLSECDFKVENAMDSFLELSVAAAAAAPIPSVSGFERTAAELLSPHHFSEPRTDSDSSKPPQQPPSLTSTSILRNELDLLVDGELEGLIAQHDFEDKHPSSPYLSSGVPFVSYPPFPQQALPELLQSSLEPKSKGPSTKQIDPVASYLEHKIAASSSSSSLDHISTRKDTTANGQQLTVDFTHLVAEIPKDKQKPLLDLAASGRPSAFQVYKKQEPLHSLSAQLGDMPSDVVVGGAKSKVQKCNQDLHGNKYSTWNLGAPVFSPRMHGNQVPTFITPVAQPPSNWLSKPRHLVPVGQAPLKPSATIPKSWAVHGAVKHSDQNSRLRLEGKLLVLLRGAPGSGKSTLARALLDHNQGGIILSTDDYFTQNGEYRFDPTFLGEAHEWNHKRAKAAFERGTNPIIIDNTNMQGWEMKPYVVQALKHGYKVLFREPDTWWKNKPRELERRTSHNVPVEKIRRMLDGYERFVTVQAIMGSMIPEHKRGLVLDNSSSKPKTSGIPCPDLVEQPELIEGFKKSRPQLFSSLPDVSSIGCSSEVGLLEDSSHKSTETIIIPNNGKPIENVEFSEEDDDMDLGNLDSELDARLQIDQSVGGQRIPDCIVESVMNEDRRGDEIPVAFSESIGQRVKRERPARRSDFDQMEPADLVKDANQSENEAREEGKDEGAGQIRLVTDEPRNRMPEMLAYVGDWPSQGSLEQRQVRRKEIRRENNCEEADGVSQEIKETLIKMQSEPVTEFQKIIDLIQTGAAAIQASSSCLSSPSQSYEEELEKDEEANGSFDKSIGCIPIGKDCREQILNNIDSSRGELPDCVLDRKSSECWAVSNSTIIGQEVLANEIREMGALDVTPANSINPLSTVIGDCVSSHTDMGNSNNNTVNVRETTTEINCSHISEECHSPICEGSVEADGSVGSQEKKQRHGRRSGKQCKLALTFTQNCPASSTVGLINPIMTAQNLDSFWIESNTDVEANCNRASIFSPTSDLLMESKSDTACFTQTEPKDFALLWRLNHQESPDNTVCNPSSDLKVVSSDSSRFVPELTSGILAKVAVHPSGHMMVPYRVVHEKGTQVEQKDLGGTQNRFESLRILSRHFKLVTFDTLEDLYDKCHQDLDWTTNLLLDSGERFFRGEDGAQNLSSMCDALQEIIQQNNCGNVLDECCYEDLQKARIAGMEEGPQQLSCGMVSESNKSFSNSIDSSCLEGVADPVINKKQVDPNSQLANASETRLSQPEATEEREHKVRSEPELDDGAWRGSLDDGVIIEETRVELEEEIASIDEVHRLLQAQSEESEREEKQRREQRRSSHLDIQSLELKLPTELALQLAELFGPVGVDPGTCSVDDYAVKMDLNLAKLVHHKWKETIQERQRRAALPFHLTKESSAYWADLPGEKPGPKKQTRSALISPDGYWLHDTRPGSQVQMPFMDHWNVSHSHVSLRDIIKEEQALQDCSEKSRKSGVDLNQRDGASQFKENQLYSRFPTIDRHFLQDILRDHNYSLTQTELFLQSLLDEEPVKTVVAPEAPRSNQHRTASKEREKRQKNLESFVLHYQNTEDPDYEDFRAEASLQRSRQLESFSKAAEAFKQGRKEVASFYAQQGHLHGLRMHEANHRAAVQIFERVNSSLLPKNILDLHGLHVNEALEHLAQVLQDKTSDCEQGLCRPQLSVITGRGNHSQGGVARIRPAVIEYLTKKQYRFTEPKPGLVLVCLK